jgi:hypothetical protein
MRLSLGSSRDDDAAVFVPPPAPPPPTTNEEAGRPPPPAAAAAPSLRCRVGTSHTLADPSADAEAHSANGAAGSFEFRDDDDDPPAIVGAKDSDDTARLCSP